MINYKKQIEEKLTNLAASYTPQRSEHKALIHQWIHALNSNTMLFAEKGGLDRNIVLDALKSINIFTASGNFKKDVKTNFKLTNKNKNKFRFIDLFAGIGGMRQGFEHAGGICVFSSEFEKNAQITYETNYGEFPFGDITTVDESLIPDHDILIAGFPCQPFSHAGLKQGIDDTRGTLFHDIARILDKKKPKFALLENVKGLISHDKGYTLQVILKVLTGIGYSCNISKDLIHNGSAKEIQNEAKKMVLKSIDFGIPQNRQRLYIVLWLDGEIDHFNYPEPTTTTTRVGDILDSNPDPKLTISDRLWDGHKRRKIQNKKNGKGFGYGIVTEDSSYTNTISARYYKDGSEVLIAQDGKNPRKLSPREAARLQGFPEDFILNSSNTQVYKQFGNSVSVPVINALAKQINDIIGQ